MSTNAPAHPFDLSGRVAIVTGGNRGIGLGIAEGFARAGAAIVIAARDETAGAAAARELCERGARACFWPADITDPSSCEALAAFARDRFGRVDILVNNAGVNVLGAPETTSLADWTRILSVNLTGAFLCAQAVYPAMRGQGGGKIINLGSLASTFGSGRAAAYAASKGGLLQLTRSLAVAWGPDNIQVNAILAGYIETEMTRQTETLRPGSFAAKLARTPAGRNGQPADVAGAAVFLASAGADFITGAALPVDGGYGIQI